MRREQALSLQTGFFDGWTSHALRSHGPPTRLAQDVAQLRSCPAGSLILDRFGERRKTIGSPAPTDQTAGDIDVVGIADIMKGARCSSVQRAGEAYEIDVRDRRGRRR